MNLNLLKSETYLKQFFLKKNKFKDCFLLNHNSELEYSRTRLFAFTLKEFIMRYI